MPTELDIAITNKDFDRVRALLAAENLHETSNILQFLTVWQEDGSIFLTDELVEAIQKDFQNLLFFRASENLTSGDLDLGIRLATLAVEEQPDIVDKLLWMVCYDGQKGALEPILKLGGNPNARIPIYGPPGLIFSVVVPGFEPWIGLDLLIRHGFDINLRDNEKNTLLHRAVIDFGTLQLIEAILERGGQIDAVNQRGQTPLSICMADRLSDKAEFLRRGGASRVKAQRALLNPKRLFTLASILVRIGYSMIVERFKPSAKQD